MKKIIFILIIVFSLILVSINAWTERQFIFDGTNATDTRLQSNEGTSLFNDPNVYYGQHPANTAKYRGLFNFSHICDSMPNTFTTNWIKMMVFDTLGNTNASPQIYPIKTPFNHQTTWANWNAGGSSPTDYNGSWNLTIANTAIGTSTYENFTLDPVWFDKLCDNTLGAYNQGIIFIGGQEAAANTMNNINSLESGVPAKIWQIFVNYSETDTTAPTITFVYPEEKKTYNNYDGWLNFTTDEDANCSVNSSWVENTTLTTSTSKYYYNVDYNNLNQGIYSVNLSCWDSLDNNGSSIMNFTSYIYNVTETFSASEFEMANSEFTLTLNVTNTTLDTIYIRSNLIYNGTPYTPSKSISGEVVTFSETIAIPLINKSSDTKTFYWNYTLTGAEGFNTTTNSQTIYQMGILSCGEDTNETTVNVSMIDELDYTNVTSTVEVYFRVWNNSEANYKNASFKFNDTINFGVCIHPSWASLHIDMYLRSEAVGYADRDLVKLGMEVSNISTNITFYQLSSANDTAITVNLRDEMGDDIEGYLVEAWYWDIASNRENLVESKLTDAEGNVILALVYDKLYYKFLFYDKTTLKKESNYAQISATSLYFSLIERVVSRLERWLRIKGMTRGISYDNTTRVLTYTWGDFPETVVKTCFNVTYGNNTHYSSGCSTTTYFSITSNLPQVNETFLATASVEDSDGFGFVLETYGVDLRQDWRIYGDEGLAIAFIIVLVVGLTSTISPIAMIIGTVLGFIIVFMFGLVPLNLQIIMGIVLVAIVAISVMMKRYRI